MSTEQLNIFYDLDKIQEINTKLDQIRNDTSLDDETKQEVFCNYLDELSDDDKREYEAYRRYAVAEEQQIKNTACCQDTYKDKVLLMEFVNQQPSYTKACAMIAMITYLQARFDSYEVEEDKPAIDRFLNRLFNGSSAKYMGTIYDLYYKNNKAKHPTFVPEIRDQELKNLMPSIEQYMNFCNHADANFEQIRAVVSGTLGFRASHEATIHVHGVFNSVDDPEITKYRINNAEKLNALAELIPVPFGRTYLYDKYKSYRSNIVLFNGSDPDVEILNSNRIATDMNNHAMFKKRLNNLEGRMSKQDLLAIKDYRSEIERLRKLPAAEKPPKVTQKIAKLNTKIDKIYEANTSDKEVITGVVKVSKGKVSKKMFAAEATN